AIDPQILKRYLPCGTELDFFEETCYVSLVGFLFTDVKLHGISIPFHTTFEEVNLRFYVRYKEGNHWKRGVVFLKEIVPRHAITFVANTLYNEKYATHPMRHAWQQENENLHIDYQWKVGREWNYIKVRADAASAPALAGSAEEFITEHYWGYTFIEANRSGTYQVAHPRWNIHAVKEHDIKCNATVLYGPQFATALAMEPCSVFLAAGSEIEVYKGQQIQMA
ncbi:MAG TPA: DUF2071 domain-containing protein, partial [Chitinophagaceae bacterium]|nr:DUF2071 domain-containing protein [Chitinophagaceae bacterium]